MGGKKFGKNWLSAVHLCYPNHWSAEEKIGKDFATIHALVAGMEKINRRGDAIASGMTPGLAFYLRNHLSTYQLLFLGLRNF
ncbi:MAG: heme-dependent oxidative N-demethylase subunit alpha family protein [Nostoc sp.]